MNSSIKSHHDSDADASNIVNENCIYADTLAELISPSIVREIPVGDTFAIVDAEDFDRINSFRWQLSHKLISKKPCAFRGSRKSLGEAPRRKVRMHHEVLRWQPQPGLVVDHINGNPLDNRKSNLRICTQADNQHNRRKNSGPQTSTYKGVHLTNRSSKPWTAQIGIKGKTRYIGCFDTAEDAARAYDHSAMLAFGVYALLNFPIKRVG